VHSSAFANLQQAVLQVYMFTTLVCPDAPQIPKTNEFPSHELIILQNTGKQAIKSKIKLLN